MRKENAQVRAGGAPVQLDAVEVSVVCAALVIVSRNFREMAEGFERYRFEGWQIHAAVVRAKSQVAEELLSRLRCLAQCELPFGFLNEHVAQIASPSDCAGAFPQPVRKKMLERRVS